MTPILPGFLCGSSQYRGPLVVDPDHVGRFQLRMSGTRNSDQYRLGG